MKAYNWVPAEYTWCASTGLTPEYDIAVVHLALGETDRAMAGLERAAASFAPSVLWVNVDYRLDAPRKSVGL